MNAVSVDKLLLYTGDFEVKQDNSFKLKSGTLDFSTGEMINEYPLFELNNDYVYGSNAYYNDENCQMSINRNGFVVQFCPSKVVNKKHNFFPVSHHSFNNSLDTIQASLDNAGVKLSLDSMSVNRLDLEKTFKVEYPFMYYSPIFHLMHAKRMNTMNYGETYTFLNKSREVCLYDKVHEMKAKKIDTSNIAGNWTRAELRLKKSKVVNSDVEVQKLSELKRKDVFLSLSDIYKNKMSQMIFNENSLSDIKLFSFKNEVELLRTYKERYSRNAILKYLMTFAIDGMKSLFITPDKLFELMMEAGYSRRHSFNAKKLLNEALKHYVEDRKDISANELYNELRMKIAS